ncbi:hypothetical protein G3M48_007625 [Beauveria asiatica]|uniref:Uncharacterized protein n=1 Tax=Beauveria asiatica TaxID=1069075 RepID=A0AAW0RLS9_9HYPO
MRWRWATLSSGLLAVRPVDGSYISKPPQTVEPTRAAVATNRLLGISPRITDAPIPDPRSLVGRAGALERESNTCGFYSDVAKTSFDSTSPSMSASKSTTSSTSRTTSFTSETSANNSTDNNNNGEKKSNTNAIVGGVVGGVGGAAILGAAIFFFMRSRKKKSVDSGSGTAAASQPVFQQHQQSPSPGQGSPLGHYPQAGSPVYDPSTAYKHYQGSPQPYPQPSQSPYDPHRSGHQSWGQPSPGLTSSPSPLGSPNPVSPTATTPGPTTVEQQKGQPVELAESNAIGTSANRAELA